MIPQLNTLKLKIQLQYDIKTVRENVRLQTKKLLDENSFSDMFNPEDEAIYCIVEAKGMVIDKMVEELSIAYDFELEDLYESHVYKQLVDYLFESFVAGDV